MIDEEEDHCLKYFLLVVTRELPRITEKVKYMHVISRKAATKPVILIFFCCNNLDEKRFPVHLPGNQKNTDKAWH